MTVHGRGRVGMAHVGGADGQSLADSIIQVSNDTLMLRLCKVCVLQQ